MISHFQKWFRKMSLTQQVISLILLMVASLIIFFIFFLSDSINQTVGMQIADMLASRQQPIVNAIDTGKSAGSDLELFSYISSDDHITTLIVTPDRVEMISGTPAGRNPELKDQMLEKAETQMTGPAAYKNGVMTYRGKQIYYRFARASFDGRESLVISYMDDVYALSMRASLLNSTIYITVLVFALLLMILLFWVFSIIHPLNQIKSYIAQIKEGKDVDLYINREDEIGEVAQELRTLTAELAKQEKAKEEMIHNISHDLKTPIATIKSYSESIKDGIYPYGDLESSVDVILDNAKRLEDKVHSLLYMNRVEYLVSSDAEGVTTNMKDVVEQVVLNAKVIRPEIELITDVEEVYFDGLFESWRVCIENILQNAFRYAKSYIRIEVHEDELRISNDGPKMPEDRIESLFKPYIKGEGGKFGLGLSIVSKVVAANKYKVQGLNTEDGVCFRIYRDNPDRKSNRSKTNGSRMLDMQHWTQSLKNGQKNEGKPSGEKKNQSNKNQHHHSSNSTRSKKQRNSSKKQHSHQNHSDANGSKDKKPAAQKKPK